MRRRLWLLGALAAVSLAAAGVASAAQLGVNPSGIDSYGKVRCTAATLATTYAGAPSGGNYASVRIAGVPAACNGLPIAITVFNASFAVIATGTGTAATGDSTIATTAYSGSQASGVALVIDGWGVDTTWTGPATGPVVTCVPYSNGGNPQPSKTCTVTISYDSGSPYGDGNGGLMTGFQINVNSTAQSWRATIDFSNSSWPFTTLWLGQTSQTVSRVGACSSPLGLVTLRPANGATWGGYFQYGDTAPPPWFSGPIICP